MIVFRKPDTCEYLQHSYSGYLSFGQSVDEAQQFEDLEDFQNNLRPWERDALSLLNIEVVTLL